MRTTSGLCRRRSGPAASRCPSAGSRSARFGRSWRRGRRVCQRTRRPHSPASLPAGSTAGERAKEARANAEEELEGLELTDRDAEQRLRRAARGAEREELLLALEELAAWYRDLIAVSVGAERAAIHVDHLAELQEDATADRAASAEVAAEIVREQWRLLEELQLQAPLAFEALFVQLRRAFAGSLVAA